LNDTNVNDAALALGDLYPGPATLEHPALRRWHEVRREQGRPFRPDYKMYTGHGSPQMTADRLHLLQDLGAESLLLAWDLPSQLGFDPDHRLARSQVGRAGVSCSSLDDMRAICSRIDLGALRSFGTLANSLGHVGFAFVHEVLREAGAESTAIYMQNDPLKEFTARGTEIFDPLNALRLACDVAEYAVRQGVPGHAITVCSNHYDIAGAGPVVGLGLALANGVAYVDDLVTRGLDPADVVKTISLFVNERSDFFITAALFRSTRVLWSDLLAERYGLDPSTLEPLHLMGYAHGLEAPEEPLVNVARVAVSVTAATFGGADTLCAAAYDEALRIPSDDAAALALRTIQVASSEHGVSDTIDPLSGGAKYESLCDEITTKARHEFDEIQVRGGAIACIENGYALSRLSEGQQHRHQQLKSGKRPWIGVNEYSRPDLRHLFSGQSQGDTRLRDAETQLADAARERKRANDTATRSPLAEVETVARSGDNIVEPVLVALRAGATTEQVMSATRRGFEGAAAARIRP
jgi:methylmalonyl-CoA mutase N-terminal domain/subunit